MKKIELPWYMDMGLLEDIKRIQDVVFVYGGFALDWEECINVWKSRSDTFNANWLVLPKDDRKVYEEIMKYSEYLIIEKE